MTESKLKLKLIKQGVLLLVHRGSVKNKNVFLIPVLNQHVWHAMSTRNLGNNCYDEFYFRREQISQIG